jgi:serine/threonine protein kinase
VSASTEGKRRMRRSPRGAGAENARAENVRAEDAGADNAGAETEAERFGQYLLYERLGHGAMASVRRGVLCRDAGFRRMVALKQLHPHLAKIPEMVEQFAHEARLGSYLRHANLAQTFDFGSVDGAYFIAMELVRGPTLAQLARQCAGAAGPIPMGIVLGILTQLCDAFDYIRNARDPAGQPLRLAHCDVSPPNIIISSTGYVKLIDFGIARAGSARPLAETGVLRRRLAYVAPEYAEGKLDARSDLFSLGVIGHELIANQPLFAGSGDELHRVREMPIPPLVRSGPVPHVLQDVIMTALQRDPARRWQTAAEMRSALADVARGMAVHIGPPQVAGWITWAFSQRLRPDAMTPLVVGQAAVRASASLAGRAAMTTASIKLPGKSPGKSAGKSPGQSSGPSPGQSSGHSLGPSSGHLLDHSPDPSSGHSLGQSPGQSSGPSPGPSSGHSLGQSRDQAASRPSVHLLSSGFTRELTRRFQRLAASRRRPLTGAHGIEPLRRKLAHTVPRGLRKADRPRIAAPGGADRSGPIRRRPAPAPSAPNASAPIAAIQVAPRPVQSLPPVASPAPSMSLSARTDASPWSAEAMRPAATVQAPAAPRDRAGRPTAPPREPVPRATGAARSTADTTGIVVVPASRPAGSTAGRERGRRTRMVRRRALPPLPAVFAVLAALVAFAFMYRWLHH